MINTLLGIKKGMISAYDLKGRRVGATILEVQPNKVTQIKTTDTQDGYTAVQIGIGSKKNLAKPQLGHLKKAGIETVRFMREVRTNEVDVEPGQEIPLSQVFSKGDLVKVTGTSKGRGFQGGVKRHGFAGGPKTHGQSDRHRAPGSIGSGTTPGRVYRGKKMAGHMGVETVSYLGLEVIKIDKKGQLLTIKGGVPGPIGGLVTIQKQGTAKGYVPEPEEEETQELAQSIPDASEETTPSSVAADLTSTDEQTQASADQSTEEGATNATS